MLTTISCFESTNIPTAIHSKTNGQPLASPTVESTSTQVSSTPSPTLTPTITNTPEIKSDTQAIRSYLEKNGFEVAEISGDGSHLLVTIESDIMDYLYEDQELEIIQQLERAETLTYLGIYILFDQFQEVSKITYQVNILGEPALRSTVNRETAYNFPPRSFSKPPTQISPQILADTAYLDRKGSEFQSFEILDIDILEIVNAPDEKSLQLELEDWLVFADIENIVQHNENDISVQINVDDAADFFADADPEAREEEINLEAGLATVDTFYSLFTRFPNIKNILVSITLRGNTIMSYEVTRVVFELIGPQEFNHAAKIGEPEDVLLQLSNN